MSKSTYKPRQINQSLSLHAFRKQLSQIHASEGQPVAPLDSFHKFPRFPKEVRLLIWEAALPDPRIIRVHLWPLVICEHAMVRVRSDTTVPDRCVVDAYPGFEGTLCEGHSRFTPEDESEFLEYSVLEGNANAPKAWHDCVRSAMGFRSFASPPNLLFACNESRKVALSSYEAGIPALGVVPNIYIDLERDELLFSYPTFVEQFVNKSQFPFGTNIDGVVNGPHPVRHGSRVRNLALKFDHPWGNLTAYIASVLPLFPNLRRLTLLFRFYRNQQIEQEVRPDMRSRMWDRELVFFEPINIEEALSMFQWKNDASRRTDIFKEMYHGIKVNKERLRQLQIEQNGVWNLPDIEIKVLTTTAVNKRFEELKQAYEKATGFVCHRIKDTDKFTVNPSLLLSP